MKFMGFKEITQALPPYFSNYGKYSEKALLLPFRVIRVISRLKFPPKRVCQDSPIIDLDSFTRRISSMVLP
jgi:hypothetical protein